MFFFKKKRDISEKEFDKLPTTREIVMFLEESKATSVSIEHNFRFPHPQSELPLE